MSRPLSVQELRDVLAAARVNRVGTIRDLVVQFNGDEDKARSFYNETPDFELYALASGPKNPATLLIVKSYDVQVNQPLRIQIVSPFENMGREAFCRPADLVPAPIDLYQEQLEVLKGSRVSITNRAELDQFLDAAFERRAQTKEEVAEAALSKEEGRTFYETHKDFYLWGFASRADGNSYTRTASGALGVILGYYPKSQEVRVRIIAAAPGYNLRSDNEFTIKAHVLRKASRDDFGAVQDGEAPAKAEEVSKAVSFYARKRPGLSAPDGLGQELYSRMRKRNEAALKMAETCGEAGADAIFSYPHFMLYTFSESTRGKYVETIPGTVGIVRTYYPEAGNVEVYIPSLVGVYDPVTWVRRKVKLDELVRVDPEDYGIDVSGLDEDDAD